MDAAVLVANVSVMVGRGDDHKVLFAIFPSPFPRAHVSSIIRTRRVPAKAFSFAPWPESNPRFRRGVLLAGHPVETLREQLPGRRLPSQVRGLSREKEDLTVAEILDFALACDSPVPSPGDPRPVVRACDRPGPHPSLPPSKISHPLRRADAPHRHGGRTHWRSRLSPAR